MSSIECTKFQRFLCFIGFLWVLPVNLLAWCWLLYLRFTGQIEKVTWYSDFAIAWDIDNNSRFFKRMKGWYGFTLGSNIICIDVEPFDKYTQHLMHETAHVYQQYIFGVFFFPVYILTSVFMYLFMPKTLPYIDNFFEKWARKYAGQPVKIPVEQRKEYMKDRWPWW